MTATPGLCRHCGDPCGWDFTVCEACERAMEDHERECDCVGCEQIRKAAMNESRKGPYEVGKPYCIQGVWSVPIREFQSGGVPGVIIGMAWADTQEEAEANARMFAAAAEMRQALQMLVNEYPGNSLPACTARCTPERCEWAQARAALAKADGKVMS